jgi:hypothetical protein
MGILNPVLWIFCGLMALVIGFIALLMSLPIGAIVFFCQNGKVNRPIALRRAAAITLLVSILLFIVGCFISAFAFQGPLAL